MPEAPLKEFLIFAFFSSSLLHLTPMNYSILLVAHISHTTLCYPEHSETSSKGQNSTELLVFLSTQGIYFINWALYFNSWKLRAYYKWKKQIRAIAVKRMNLEWKNAKAMFMCTNDLLQKYRKISNL